MYQKNLKELKEKISREQAILELRGEVTISYEERTIQVITIEYEDAKGYKAGNKIFASPEEAIAAARREIGDKFGEQVNVALKDGAVNGLKAVSSGLTTLSDLARTWIYVLTR